jgi:hypothetical protein
MVLLRPCLLRTGFKVYRATSLIGNRPLTLGLPQEPRHGLIVGSYRVAVSNKPGTPVESS